MPRALSAAAKAAIHAPETGEAFLMLLTIAHDDLEPPIRVVHNTGDVVSRGETYVAFPFGVALPDEDPESVARVSLVIDNVDRRVVDALRLLTSPPTVTLEVVLGSSPDTVEAGPFHLTLQNASYDALQVTGELAFEDVLNEPFPAGRFTPADFPGLF